MDESGKPASPILLEGAAGVAGSEQTRERLWGSRVVVALGASFLPKLAHQDLWVENSDLEEFRKECLHILDNVSKVAESTPWDEGYISFRLRNFIDAIDEAIAVGGGVVID